MKRQGSDKAITTDGMRSHKGAMKKIGNAENSRLAVGPTTAVRPYTGHSGDESGPC